MDFITKIKKTYENYENNKILECSFKKKHTFEHRKEESDRILAKYPDRIPVLCEKITQGAPDIDRHKFLCPGDLSMSNFMYVLRKRMNMKSEYSLYLFVNNKIIQGSAILSQVYDVHRDEDGFLYIRYSTESTFGN